MSAAEPLELESLGEIPRRLRVRANGADLHLLEWGAADAPAVLMTHGMRGHARWFTPVGPALAPHFRALSLDLRGHGQSEHTERYGFSLFCDDVAELVDALELDRPILLGHSMGGSVMLHAAAELGDRLRGLVMVDSSLGSRAPHWQRWWWRMRYRLRMGTAPDIPTRSELRRPPRIYDSREAALARFRLTPGDNVVRPELLDHLAHHALRELPDGRFTWAFDPRVTIQRGRPRRIPDPRRLRCPVVLIYGAESNMRRWHDPDRTRRMFRNAAWTALETIPGAHHHVFLDQPDAFNRVLLPYLLRMIE